MFLYFAGFQKSEIGYFLAPKRTMASAGSRDLHYNDIVSLSAKNEIILIDVREPAEIQETGKLPGSTHIPCNYLLCNLIYPYRNKEKLIIMNFFFQWEMYQVHSIWLMLFSKKNMVLRNLGSMPHLYSPVVLGSAVIQLWRKHWQLDSPSKSATYFFFHSFSFIFLWWIPMCLTCLLLFPI